MEDLLTRQPEKYQPELWLPSNAGALAIDGEMAKSNELWVPQNDKEELMGKIVDFGTLSQVIDSGSGEVFRHPPSSIWTGSISLRNRLKESPKLADTLERVLSPENIERYYVKANLASRTRCIDGRLLEGWLESVELRQADLGAQVPGGTATMALAMRLVEDAGLSPDVTLSDDIDNAVGILKQHNLPFGGHIDEGHGDDSLTGCGAIDKLRGIVMKSLDPITAFQMKGLIKAMLGDSFNREIYHSIVGEIRDLWAMEEVYLARNKDGAFEYNKHAIEALRRNATEENPVAKLTGPHNEVGLVINTVEGTTFDRDRFSSDNNNEIQLFNYDLWRSKQMSVILYPADTHKQQKFIMARAMFAVATAMELTDGSIRLLVRN